MIKSSSFAEDVVAWCRTAKEEGVKFEVHVSEKGLTEVPFVRMMSSFQAIHWTHYNWRFHMQRSLYR